jgi:GNAT superfamily N-acetyltransferase
LALLKGALRLGVIRTIFRDATADDAAAIAGLHAESWRSAYRGTFADHFLENRVHDERRESWQARFSGGESEPFFVLLAENAGQIAGFACVFPEKDLIWGSYLDNLHVAPELTGKGIGRNLLSEIVLRLDRIGSRGGLYLWVVERNHRARRFYEKAGGSIVGSEVHTMPDGQKVVALRCHWPDPHKLLL